MITSFELQIKGAIRVSSILNIVKAVVHFKVYLKLLEDHEVHVGDRVARQAGQSHKVANELKYQTRYNIRQKIQYQTSYNIKRAKISDKIQ